MYHQIESPPVRGTPLRGLVVSPESFSRQMSFLRLLGYRGLSMSDLEPYLDGKMHGKVVGITFDDGYQNNLINALPVLMKYGFTATCYGVSSMIGKTNSWDINIGVPQKKLMNFQEWCVWRDAGMDIGSHTRTHANLKKLSIGDAKNEIIDSKKELQLLFGEKINSFCYPYGAFDAIHSELVKQAGYTTATTIVRGHVKSGDDMYTLRRAIVARSTHIVLFAAKIMTAYEARRA